MFFNKITETVIIFLLGKKAEDEGAAPASGIVAPVVAPVYQKLLGLNSDLTLSFFFGVNVPVLYCIVIKNKKLSELKIVHHF